MTATISALVINYQTPDLLETAVRSFRTFYPDVTVLIVDNGSRDMSREVIDSLAREGQGKVEAVFLDQNVYHGPAMHLGLQRLQSDLVYVFDSDTETLRGGFLEPMTDWLEADPSHYGIGHRVFADRRGFAAEKGIPVLYSAHMTIKRDVYLSLPPFIHHGLPALQNFKAAFENGLTLASFPIEEYVLHLGRGTATRYGYGLGLRSKVDYLLHRLGL